MAVRVLLPISDVDYAGTDSAHSAPHPPVYPILQLSEPTPGLGFGTDGYVTCKMQEMPVATSISAVTVTIQYVSSGGGVDACNGRVYIQISGTKYYGSDTLIQGGGTLSQAWALNPATAAAWTTSTVNAIEGSGVEVYDFINTVVTFMYALTLTITYVAPAPATAPDSGRHIASTELWLSKYPERKAKITGGLNFLANGLLGPVDVEHIAGPSESFYGWGERNWERRAFAVHGITIDQSSYEVTLSLKDQRPMQCLVRDLAYSPKASGAIRDGIARFSTPGSYFVFTRASTDTFTNPVGESEISQNDVECYGDGGLYIRPASGPRAVERYYVTNNVGARTWSAAQGSFQCQINLATVSGSNQAIAFAYHDANNWAYLFWNGAFGRFVFRRLVGGVSYDAFYTITPSSSTWYQIGCRWTGVNEELGLAAYTAHIFVDGVVGGTAGLASGPIGEVATSYLDFGSATPSGSAETLNGQIRKIHSYQYVLTDEEMAQAI